MAQTQLRTFSTLTAAGGLLTFPGLQKETLYMTGGRDAIGDGGEAFYYYDPLSSTASNGSTVEAPTRAKGRLLRLAIAVGGTSEMQYDEGEVQATPTGTVLLYQGAGDALKVPSAAEPMPMQQAALTPAVDSATAVADVGRLSNAGTILTPKYAAIGVNGSGDNTLVAAVTGNKIRVLSLSLVAAGTVSLYILDGAGTVLFGGSSNKIALVANNILTLGYNQVGWFETGSGQLLKVNLSGTVAVAGVLTYVEV